MSEIADVFHEPNCSREPGCLCDPECERGTCCHDACLQDRREQAHFDATRCADCSDPHDEGSDYCGACENQRALEDAADEVCSR